MQPRPGGTQGSGALVVPLSPEHTLEISLLGTRAKARGMTLGSLLPPGSQRLKHHSQAKAESRPSKGCQRLSEWKSSTCQQTAPEPSRLLRVPAWAEGWRLQLSVTPDSREVPVKLHRQAGSALVPRAQKSTSLRCTQSPALGEAARSSSGAEVLS